MRKTFIEMTILRARSNKPAIDIFWGQRGPTDSKEPEEEPAEIKQRTEDRRY